MLDKSAGVSSASHTDNDDDDDYDDDDDEYDDDNDDGNDDNFCDYNKSTGLSSAKL